MEDDSDKTRAQLKKELTGARERIARLEKELEETQQGLNALSLELEERVEERTAELEQAKEDFKSIVENASEGIFRISPDGKEFLLANPALADMLGYDSVNQLLETVEDIPSHLAVDKERYRELLKSAESKKNVTGIEIPFSHKDGSRLWLRVSLQSVQKEDDLKHYEGIADDITEERKLRERLVALHENLDLLQEAETKRDAYRAALHSAQDFLSLRDSIIYELKGCTLYPTATSESLSCENFPEADKGESVAGDALSEGRTIIKGSEKPFVGGILPGKYDSLISVPIGSIGVFQAVSTKIDAFSNDDVRLAELLSRHLKQELERITLETKLTELSRRDPLTGLYNRYYFEEALDQEIERSKRYNHPLGFLMIDINGFKGINDSHGHQIGDRVLARIAEILDENVREADTVVRYGGDEFLVMMPETEKGANRVSRRFKRSVEKWSKNFSRLNNKVSLAIGKSYWYPDDQVSVKDIIALADKRMYEDKQSDDPSSQHVVSDKR